MSELGQNGNVKQQWQPPVEPGVKSAASIRSLLLTGMILAVVNLFSNTVGQALIPGVLGALTILLEIIFVIMGMSAVEKFIRARPDAGIAPIGALKTNYIISSLGSFLLMALFVAFVLSAFVAAGNAQNDAGSAFAALGLGSLLILFGLALFGLYSLVVHIWALMVWVRLYPAFGRL
ncbi:MAG: hypothetical protein IJ523_05640 [Succinivibrionaceae bacterium]|nr:hypothetical protein [Succinivibrionaceae bacterium]